MAVADPGLFTAVPDGFSLDDVAVRLARPDERRRWDEQVESFRSMLKRGYVGTFHRMSPEHLHRYVREFEGRHNARDLDTIDQLGAMV